MTRQDQQVSVSPGERLAVCEILDDVTDPGGTAHAWTNYAEP